MSRKTIMTATVILVFSGIAAAQPGGSISGQWEGVWTNTNGSQGQDWLSIVEDPSGRVYGEWLGFQISGERVGPNRYVWQGESRGRVYRATARLSRGGRSLNIDYDATSYRGGGVRRYGGSSRLWRVGY
jgi:hypothetical protein